MSVAQSFPQTDFKSQFAGDSLNILLIYSSLTGNTKTMTEKIANQFANLGHNCTIKNLVYEQESLTNEALQEYDLIGFGTLVTGYQPIYHFKDYMKTVRALQGKGVFVYCTYGGKCGAGLKHMKKALKKSSGTFLGGDAFVSSDEIQLLLYCGWYFNHNRPNQEEFDQAKGFVDSILQNYSSFKAGQKFKAPLRKGGTFTGMMSRVYTRRIVAFLCGVKIDSTKCNQCGWCVGICPSHCLVLEEGAASPRIEGKCQGCAYCERRCPQRAISFKHKKLAVFFTKVWGNMIYRSIPRRKLTKEEIKELFPSKYAIGRHLK
ncbi:MAG: EFR1 family ferrodoxin [Candidatus Hodarchaeales archaeon]|jgi:flavodoxin/NAD-dependent dihydropyrimidine dehydrogenase PreA subunit